MKLTNLKEQMLENMVATTDVEQTTELEEAKGDKIKVPKKFLEKLLKEIMETTEYSWSMSQSRLIKAIREYLPRE